MHKYTICVKNMYYRIKTITIYTCLPVDMCICKHTYTYVYMNIHTVYISIKINMYI